MTAGLQVRLAVAAWAAGAEPAVRESAGSALSAARRAVGLPTRAVEVALEVGQQLHRDEVGRLVVGGEVVPLLARDVYGAAASIAPDGPQPADDESARRWLERLDPDTLGRAVEHVVTATVERSADLLVVTPDAETVWGTRARPRGLDVDRLLRDVLRRGADLNRLPDDLQAGDQPSAELLTEQVLDRIGPDRLVVSGSAAQIRSVTTLLDGDEGLRQLRARFLVALGVPVPDLDVLVDRSVPDSQLRLALGPIAAPAEPLPGDPSAEVLLARLELHLARRVERLVRPAAVSLLHAQLSTALPRLVEEVESCWDAETTSAILARLVRRAGGASPVDTFSTLAEAATGWTAEPVDTLLRRAAAAHTLALATSIEHGAVRVLELDRELQKAPPDRLAEVYLGAVGDPAAGPLPVLVDDDRHASVQDLFRLRFPGVPVLARIDLPPGVTVHRETLGLKLPQT